MTTPSQQYLIHVAEDPRSYSRPQNPCKSIVCGGCMVLILFAIVAIFIGSLHMLQGNLDAQQREILNLKDDLEGIWTVFLESSIRVVDNDTDTVDMVILHTRKNSTNVGEMLYQKYNGHRADKRTLHAAYFGISGKDCITGLPSSDQGISCWEKASLPKERKRSVKQDVATLNPHTGVVKIEESGIFHIFAQLTFHDNAAFMADEERKSLQTFYQEYSQFSMSIGEVRLLCNNPATKVLEDGGRYRTCFMEWTGELQKGDTVVIGSTMAKWKIVNGTNFTYWGLVQLYGYNKHQLEGNSRRRD